MVCSNNINPIDSGWFKKNITKEIIISHIEKNIFVISKNSLLK